MTRFNQTATQPKPLVGAIRSETIPSARSALGGVGYLRDDRSELLLLGATNMVGQDAHHEDAVSRDTRYAHLIQLVAQEDGGLEWLAQFFGWLRTKANMRTAPYVGAAHLVAARRGMPDEDGHVRQAVANSLGRADEPGELIAFWKATYGGQLPRPLKRGIAKAVVRLYTERSTLTWDTASKAFRFGRVLDLTHPTRNEIEWQVTTLANQGRRVRVSEQIQRTADLFGYLGHRMRDEDVEIPESLAMLRAHAEVMAIPQANRAQVLQDLRSQVFAKAGMKWRAAASWYGQALDATFWSSVIPTMSVQELLMNLRNFEQAGIGSGDVDFVCALLEDEVRVQQSRVLPMQVLSAYRAVSGLSDNYGRSLNRALEHSLANVPALDGNTLILVDTSASMNDRLSAKSELLRWDAAVVFAVALAKRAEQAGIVSFSSARKYWGEARGAKTKGFAIPQGETLLKSIERWKNGGYNLGGGTDTALALRAVFNREFTRVVIITDEQEGEDPVEIDQSIPQTTPLVTLNLAGYRTGHAPSGTKNRVAIGGFNDAAFAALATVDQIQRGGRWPWETAPVD
jgi:TROVE domain-containing protein/VWA domain-containing protein